MADPDADWEAKCGELEKMNKKLKAKLRKTLQEKDELIAAAAAAPAGDGSAAPAEGAAPAAGGDGDSAERIAALETEVHEGKVLIKKLKTKVRQLMAEAAEGGGGGGGEAAAGGEAAGGEAAAGVDMAKFNKMKRNLGKYKKAYEKNEALNKKLKARCKQLIAKNKQLAASGGGGGEGDDDTDGGGGGDSAALAKALATNKKLKVKCRALIAELDEARAGGGGGDGSGEGTLSGTDGGSESAAAAVAPYKRKLAEAKREIEKLKVKLRATLRAARDGGGGDDDNGGEGGSSGAADGDGDGASGAEVTDLKARLKKEKALNSKLKARVRELQAAAADGGSGGGDGGADSAALEEAQAAAATAAAQLEEVRVELKVAERKFEESEAEMARIAEMSNDIEMLNLDKEIAEVRAETLEYEIRELQEEIEDLRLEIEIYKEEEEEATAGDDDESKDEKIKRSSKKYRSMAKQNKKLKEALVHVREISLADQTEFRSMIDELEAQCRAVPELTKQVETYTAQVAELEAAAVELQEAAAAGEALQSEFETATARVEELEAEAEDLKAAVKDLDDLLKVADEIDMGHTEHEDDLMQEIEDRYSDIDRLRAAGVAKDEEIRALQRQLASLRELVLSLETQVREGGGAGVPATEAAADDGGAGVGAGGAAEDADIDRAMALHRLTQHKKDEAREMELALLRKDAEQGAAHVSMLEEFMPPFFFASNNEHIMFLLFVERLAFKTDMIVDNFTSKYDMRAGTRNGVPVSTDEVAFGARVLATLAPFAQALTQIQAELARTDEETFLRVASQYRDLLPYEERLDKFIRQVRTDGVSFASDLGDLKEMATRFSFLEREDLKVGELPSGTAFVYDMDAKHHQAAVLLTAFRAFSDLIKNESEGQDSESTVALLAQAGKIDDALSKAVKTFVKFDRKYEKTPVELPNEPLRMLDEAQGVLDTQTEVAHNLCEKFRTALVNSPTGKVGAPEVSALVEGVCGAGGLGSFLNAAQTFRDNVADVTEGAINRHYVARGSGGGDDGAGGDDPDHVPVWHTRAEAVKEKIARAADVELRLDEALADAHARLTELKVKDQAVKDMQVKADVLAKRIETLQGEAAAVDELRDELAAAQKEEEHYKEAIAHLEADLHALEQRTNTARKKTGRNSSPRGNPLASLLSSVTTPTAASPSSPGFPGANDSGHSSIGSPLNRSRAHGGSSPSSVNATNASVLQDLVHHLRRDNARLHATDAMRRMKKLRPLTTGAQLRAGTKKEDAPRLLRMRRRQSRASIVTAAISYDDCKREVSSLLRFTRSMMASSTVVDLQAEDGMDITAQWSQRLASLSRLQKRSAEIRHKAQAVIMEKKQGAAKSTLIAPFPTPELNRVLAVDENTPLIGRVRIPKRSVAPALQQKLGIADGSTAKIVIGRRDMVKLHSVFASA